VPDQTAFADDEDLRKGAVIRLGAIGRGRPYCLEIVSREPVSQVTGAISVVGKVLAADGTTTRRKPLFRNIVVLPGRYEFVHKVPRFTAKLAHLFPEAGGMPIIRWAVVNDATGEPLPGEGTGPARVGDYVMPGDWEGKPTPWLAREYYEKTEDERRLRRDPLDQCVDRAAQERGIIRIGRLTYDVSVWNHASGQELREVEPGIKAWRSTYVCRRCGCDLRFLNRSPWVADLNGGTECHGTTWMS
jgi:hypothetical protein